MGVGCTGVGVALGVGVGRAIASDKLAGTIGGAVVGIALIAPLLALAVSAGIRKQMRLT